MNANGDIFPKPRLPWWMGPLNFWVLQWFFLRLARCFDGHFRPVGWKWIFGAVPVTGWFGTHLLVIERRECWKVGPQKRVERKREGRKV